MIPRPQHLGDRAPFPCDWSGIVRIFEKPVFEALFLSAGGRAHYPGEQANASIEQDHGAKLAAREDIVAETDLDIDVVWDTVQSSLPALLAQLPAVRDAAALLNESDEPGA